MKKRILIAVCLLMHAGAIAQNYSTLYRYNNLKGNHVIIRTDQTNTYFVTSYRPNLGRSCFIVKNSNSTRYFDMRECYENSPLTYAYLVNDMQIQDDECYFCGRKWFYTGEMIYYPDGTMELEVDSIGFFGKFNVNDVLSGTGTYEILELIKTKTLTKLAVYPGGATAVGVSDSMDHSCLVELHETGIVGGVMNYKAKILHSTIPDEVFMDVVHTSTKVTTVSRYNNPQRYVAYRDYFGLRTGSPLDFLGTNNGINNYSAYSVFGDEHACFSGVDPVCLSAVNVGEAVTVSYLMSAIPLTDGKVISYRINIPGQQTTGIQYNYDNNRYKRILEAKFNMSLNNNTNMAIVLEDEDGKSIIRFPCWNNQTTYCDTILYSDSVTVQSLAPFQLSSNTFCLAMGGYFHNNMKKIAELRNYDIHGSNGLWSRWSCLPKINGTWLNWIHMITPILDERNLHGYDIQTYLVFKRHDFVSHKVNPEVICEQ